MRESQTDPVGTSLHRQTSACLPNIDCLPNPNIERVGRVVVGAGIGGMYAAFMRHKHEDRTVIVERHKDSKHDLSFQDDMETGSGDNTRGLRLSFQPAHIVEAIQATLEVLKTLPEKGVCTKEELDHIVFRSQSASQQQPPYLIGVESIEDLEQLQDQFEGLIKHDSSIAYKPFTVEQIKNQYGIQFPHGYAAVINEISAGRLNIRFLQQRLLHYLTENQGAEYQPGTEISFHVKLKDGTHLAQLSNGRWLRTKELVLATGESFSNTLSSLVDTHNRLASIQTALTPFLADGNVEIPERLRQTIKVPLQAFFLNNIKLPPNVTPSTIYHMGRHGENVELELFLFPKAFRDINGDRYVDLKFGYDANHIRVALESEGKNQQEIKKELRDIAWLLSHLVADSYGLEQADVYKEMQKPENQANCGYFFSMKESNGPILGRGPMDILCVAHLQGWGAMALLGAFKLFNEGKLDDKWDPSSKPKKSAEDFPTIAGHTVFPSHTPRNEILPSQVPYHQKRA